MELEDFIEQLKSGKVEFYSRHQEDGWGCRYLGDGKFLKWSKNFMEYKDEAEKEELNEAEVRKLFSIYNIENLQKGLIPLNKYKFE